MFQWRIRFTQTTEDLTSSVTSLVSIGSMIPLRRIGLTRINASSKRLGLAWEDIHVEHCRCWYWTGWSPCRPPHTTLERHFWLEHPAYSARPILPMTHKRRHHIRQARMTHRVRYMHQPLHTSGCVSTTDKKGLSGHVNNRTGCYRLANRSEWHF